MNTRIRKGNIGIVTAIFALCVMPLLLAAIVFYHVGLSGSPLNKGHVINNNFSEFAAGNAPRSAVGRYESS